MTKSSIALPDGMILVERNAEPVPYLFSIHIFKELGALFIFPGVSSPFCGTTSLSLLPKEELTGPPHSILSTCTPEGTGYFLSDRNCITLDLTCSPCRIMKPNYSCPDCLYCSLRLALITIRLVNLFLKQE